MGELQLTHNRSLQLVKLKSTLGECDRSPNPRNLGQTPSSALAASCAPNCVNCKWHCLVSLNKSSIEAVADHTVRESLAHHQKVRGRPCCKRLPLRARPAFSPSSSLIAFTQPPLRQVPISFFGYEHFSSAGPATSRTHARINSDSFRTPQECPPKLPRHARLATSSSPEDFFDTSQSPQPERLVVGEGLGIAAE